MTMWLGHVENELSFSKLHEHLLQKCSYSRRNRRLFTLALGSLTSRS